MLLVQVMYALGASRICWVLEQKYSLGRTLKFLEIFDLQPKHIQLAPSAHMTYTLGISCTHEKLPLNRVQP